ncbi:MAG: hypothetical protein N0A16_06775 [Blastocatellia bacterium]|nr:hypothetical protein [Blastocatellia bacterium]MCS7157413.1 hypothetical protein [Blastocatellia bacterium]MCX7752587.1 hypothetical protein [Blastocatellia bacterium]MDW8168318.1 hypothetical protein [Acidobacteriota bacterium]MDW8255514.1 hypothetical protein [Acidobacteriota bacterium]
MNSRWRIPVSVILGLAMARGFFAVPQEAATVTVAEGTVLRLALQTPVSTKISEVGDPVRATLYDDLLVEGKLVLERGAEFLGRVTHVKPARRGQRQSELALVFDRMRTSYGVEPVATTLVAIDDWQGDRKVRADEEGVAHGGRSGERTFRNVYRGAHVGLAAGSAVGLITGSGKAAGIVIASTLGGAVLMTKGEDLRLNPGTILRVRVERPLSLPVIRSLPESRRPGERS